MKLKVFLLLYIVFTCYVIAQDDDDEGLLLGKQQKYTNAAVYDLSDPTGVNVEVNIWGFVRLPGRYIVPVKTSFMDLMSYAGGPMPNSNLKDIRIVRNTTEGDTKPKIIHLNYNDLLWEDKISGMHKINPELISGDVVIVMEEKRYSLREDIGFFLPILSTLIAITTLIVTITRK